MNKLERWLINFILRKHFKFSVSRHIAASDLYTIVAEAIEKEFPDYKGEVLEGLLKRRFEASLRSKFDES